MEREWRGRGRELQLVTSLTRRRGGPWDERTSLWTWEQPKACRDPCRLHGQPGKACTVASQADEGRILCGRLRSPPSLSGARLLLSLSFSPRSLARSLFGAHLVMVMGGGGAKKLPSLALLDLRTQPSKDKKLEESIATQLRELPEKNN